MSDSRRTYQLPKRTRERVIACEAVGLSYWADHPKASHLWAVDDHQRAHVVRFDRAVGFAQHVCSGQPFEAERCEGDGEAVPYQSPGAA